MQLLGRAEGRRHVHPPDSGRRGGLVVLQSEGGDERRIVAWRDVVGHDATPGPEVAEVERRPVDGATASARPLDLGDAQAVPLGGLGQRLGLQNRAEGRRAVAERLAVDVERVVRRPMDARPRPGGQGVPAGARVRGGLGEQPVVGSPCASAQQVAEARRDAGVCVLLDGVLAQSVGGEEEQLAVRRTLLCRLRCLLCG